MSLLYDFIKELLLSYKLYPKIAIHGAALGAFLFLMVLSVILFFISRAISIRIISRLVRRTKSLWGVFLYQHRVFQILTHFLPAVLIYSSSGFANLDLPWLPGFILGCARLYIVMVFISASLKFLDAAQDIYETYPYAKERSIKGYIQLVQILIYCAGGIFILAILLGQNPINILTGLGALTAILAFVFKDPILGFVASIQLAANKMVKQGDWITIPQREIDGTVIDITLTTVKIQNWDKTITTIPTYSLVSEPMKNWNGMVESGGRRVQKSINIDMTSVKFCDKALLDKLKKAPFLFDFFKSIHTEDLKPDSGSSEIQFTNLTLFKKYLENFIDTHPSIHQELTKMVRLLPSSERGLPVEITFFSNIQEAMGYEKLQSSVFDHIIAIIPEFDLRVFQNPSGNIFYPSGNHQNVGNLVRNS